MRSNSLKAAILCALSIQLVALHAAFGQNDKTDEKSIVRKAIAAEGGREKLVQRQRAYSRLKVKVAGSFGVFETWSDFPTREKTVARYENKGEKIVRIRVVNEKEEWEKFNDDEAILAGEIELMQSREAMHQGRVLQLFPLLEDPKLQAKYLGEVMAGERGIQQRVLVKATGYEDIHLYFDKTSGLLARDSFKSIDPKILGKRVDTYRTDYRQFNGFKIASKIVIKVDDSILSEDEVLEFRPLKEFPKGFFDKP